MTASAKPKSESVREATITIRTYQAVRDAIDEVAEREHRPLSQMTELLIREALIARLKAEKRSTKEIEALR